MNNTQRYLVKNDLYAVTLCLHLPGVPPQGTRVEVSGSLYKLAMSGDADAINCIKDTLFRSIQRLSQG